MEVRELDVLVRGYQERAFSHNTVKAYKVHRKSYLTFCLRLGERPVPASPLLLCRYVAFLAKRLKFSSVRQYLNVVGLLHKECGLPNPLLNNYRLLMTLRGVRRVLGDTVCRKEPITPVLLFRLLRGLDVTNPRHAAVWAAALLMFFGLLRRSNVIPPSGALFDPQCHLKRDDLSLTPGGVRVTIRWSKTDQFRTRKRVIPYPRIKGHPLCPTQAVFNAFRLTPTAPPDGPAFPSGPAKGAPPISPTGFTSLVMAALRRAGVNTAGLGSHSFRRGGASFLWSVVGVDEGRIRELGDWASTAYTVYAVSDESGLKKTTGAMAAALPLHAPP